MRGSVYYQTSLLAKTIFVPGAKKEQRTDPGHPYYQCVASYRTMETYRNVWNNLGHYLREHWKLRDFEQITAEHIDAYISYKIEYYPSRQYLEKIVSAIGKLEWALHYLSKAIHGKELIYDFGIRSKHLHYAKVQKLVAEGYHKRTYFNPYHIIDHLSCDAHKLAATIQLEGGARSEGVTLIKPEQLKGYEWDRIGDCLVGLIETREKGGKVGNVRMHRSSYGKLREFLEEKNVFSVKYRAYAEDIRQTCLALGYPPQGSHGFRWTFARNRVRAYQEIGYSYEQALQGVSWEMKHFRPDITEHYLG